MGISRCHSNPGRKPQTGKILDPARPITGSQAERPSDALPTQASWKAAATHERGAAPRVRRPLPVSSSGWPLAARFGWFAGWILTNLD